ncbi:hypothetical protein L6452_25323 [Arctium lappa]|uniref:Uncharacterized protein n=1 Tax=Arctium lappa TaxID=4217 RepID=A0ACB9AAS2_ARCLA|nr:hypothetical protein L6452_25323 [Arctium lappa]
MDNKITAFTFFTFLLFIVSAARLAVDPAPLTTTPSAVQSEDASKTSQQSAADSNIFLPGEKPKSDLDANNHLPEPEKTTNDLTSHANFSRFHPINRHFRGKVPPQGPKPIGKQRRANCRHSHKIPRTEISERMDNIKPKASRGEIQSNWFKIQHQYGLRRHHNNNHRDENVINTKQVFDREKLKSSVRQQKQKKREEEAGFMKSIRKFLKHTFD